MARRILIVGASSTLGLAIAQRLGEGSELWLTHRNPDKREILLQCPGVGKITTLDISGFNEVERFCKQIREEWGGLDGFVFAAGEGTLMPHHHISVESIDSALRVNLEAPIWFSRALFPALLKGVYPSVVFFSSTMGLVGASGMSVYSATKAGIANLTRSLAVEWAARRIRVNAVAPGIVQSPLVEKMFASLTGEQIETIRGRHPLGFGTPEDVAVAVEFLLSPTAKWITGIVLPVDGGYTAQ